MVLDRLVVLSRRRGAIVLQYPIQMPRTYLASFATHTNHPSPTSPPSEFPLTYIFYTPPSTCTSRISGQPPRQQEKTPSSILPPLPPNSTPIYFRLNEHPSVSLAFPPVGWHSTVLQPPQMTTVWACEKTVVMVKQPGHLTSMKKERGAGTRV